MSLIDIVINLCVIAASVYSVVALIQAANANDKYQEILRKEKREN